MIYLLMAALVSTLVVLILGVLSMAKGGKVNEKYGNKLMRLRVLFQGIAILCIVLMLILKTT